MLSHADTSIKYFLREHVADYLTDFDFLVSYENESFHYDICLFSENSASLQELKNNNVANKYIVLDPKMNSREHMFNISHSDGAIVSSLEQAERAYKYQRNILVQPWFRFIDFNNRKLFVPKKSNPVINIVYHGNKVHLEAMKDTLAPALTELSTERNIVFTAIYNIKKLGMWKRNLPKGVRINHLQWNPDTYLEQIASADIGVIPNFLPTGSRNFNYLVHKVQSKFILGQRLNIDRKDYLHRYKFTSNSGRLYEYALLKKPVVAEPTLSISQDIEHDKSGFLVLTKEGWHNSLLKLIDNAVLRKKVGVSLNLNFFHKHNKEDYLRTIKLFLETILKNKN